MHAYTPTVGKDLMSHDSMCTTFLCDGRDSLDKPEERTSLYQLQLTSSTASSYSRSTPIYSVVQHCFSDQSMISPYLICLTPTSNTTSPGLLTPTTYRVAMMIVAKDGAVTTATAAMTTVRKARAPGNFVNANQITPYAADQTFCLKLSHALLFF